MREREKRWKGARERRCKGKNGRRVNCGKDRNEEGCEKRVNEVGKSERQDVREGSFYLLYVYVFSF